MTKLFFLIFFSSLIGFSPVHGEKHSINFQDVSAIEFVRFVSKISDANFIYDRKELNFQISFSTGKPMETEEIVKGLVQMLRVRGFGVEEEESYYVIHRLGEDEEAGPLRAEKKPAFEPIEFLVYKLQYQQGDEILGAAKKVASDLLARPETSQELLSAIQTIQWVKPTNSLLCSADPSTLIRVKQLIKSLDIPLKQVFIEVLVIETDVKKSLDFGLQWGANAHTSKGDFNFDLSVIGDILLHKGKSFLSINALASALQVDGDTTITLNQKLITQDNKTSSIFVGDNIPFTGAVIKTVGQSQQTTANVEYRDVGVSLSITPRLGEGNVITLDINEEITESLDLFTANADSGIRTTKTNMVTSAHVPDKHFLVLSGMIRSTKSRHKAGLPCLGGLPGIGSLFSKTKHLDEKRSVLIFVRPSIIHTFDQVTSTSSPLDQKTP